MITFRIITIPDNQINADDPTCIINAFKYMVEVEQTGDRWFGSNSYEECENYINQHSTLV